MFCSSHCVISSDILFCAWQFLECSINILLCRIMSVWNVSRASQQTVSAATRRFKQHGMKLTAQDENENELLMPLVHQRVKVSMRKIAWPDLTVNPYARTSVLRFKPYEWKRCRQLLYRMSPRMRSRSQFNKLTIVKTTESEPKGPWIFRYNLASIKSTIYDLARHLCQWQDCWFV